ncbi:PEGA domain-containing protein [Patescibacteria group bacterium]|nr:MAG: PEGA domain-containing protein [Patescibacteria group bacterium]
MDNLHLSRLQKNVIFGVFIFFTLLVFYAIFNISETSGKYNLTVTVIPSDATITINGIRSSSVASLYPGVYSVTVTRDGFTTDTQAVDLSHNLTISSYLAPVSDVAKKWAQGNASAYPEDFDYTTGQQPILAQLPDSNLIYSISADSSATSENPPRITIDSLPGYYNAPIDRIRSMGFDPENYVYTFKFGNPFK